MMESEEATVVRGEFELAGPNVCRICSGHGKYACVHCERDDTEYKQGYLFDECRACIGDGPAGEHICPRCCGNGRCSTFEELFGFDVENPIRDVEIDGYRLQIWDANKQMKSGQSVVGYRLTNPVGLVLFEADDYGCAPSDALDGDNCIRGLLGFLTLQPGDTDEEYFYKYNEAQWEFAEGPAEQLNIWALEPEDCSGLEDAERDEDGDIIWFRDWPAEDEGKAVPSDPGD